MPDLDRPPGLTVFAGPNGSGKSSIKALVPSAGLGHYINADDLAAGYAHQLRSRMRTSRWRRLPLDVMAFLAARTYRRLYIWRCETFSYETVFSHRSGLEDLKRAKRRGFVVEVFFVATENSRINVRRVQERVAKGGHDVPVDKIIERWRRSLALAPQIAMIADRTLLYDNSDTEPRLVAEILRRDPSDERPKITFFKPLPSWVVGFAQELAALLDLSG
ncbi:MAG: hypothetical protein AAFQ42_00885 [Pseudomonadota bacterium]